MPWVAGAQQRHRDGIRTAQVTAGALALVAVLSLGTYLRGHPGPLTIDRWVTSSFSGMRIGVVAQVTKLGSMPVLVVGSLLCGAGGARLGARRALSCLLGPAVAAASAELGLKPAVGRHLDGVLTFPSGTVVVVVALSVAAALALRGWARASAIGLGCLLSASVIAGVVAMQWHYFSDAVAGAAWGAGVVILLDGLLRGRWLPGVGDQVLVSSTTAPSRMWMRRRDWRATSGS